MRINRDSLLVKIIFYNNIAIILTAIAIAFVTTFITFEDMESRLVMTAREKVFLIERAKVNYLSKVREDLYEALSRNENDLINKNVDYNIIVKILRNELLGIDFKTYYRIGVAVINDKGVVLGGAGDRNVLDSRRCFTNTNIFKEIDNGNYIVEIDNKLYAKVFITYSNEKDNRKYIVAVVPLDLNFVQYIRNFIELGSNDKIFSVIENKYSDGDFYVKKRENFLNKETYNTLKKNNYKYFYKKREVEDEAYYIGILPLRDYKNDYVGSFGVAISRAEVSKTKTIIGIFIGILVLFLTGIFSTTFSRIFKKLLSPLKDITDSAEKISMGNYETPIKLEGSGEIKTLSISLKKMIGKIEENQKNLKIKNKKLKENLNKMITIEQLLLGIQIEDDVTATVRKIMLTFISEMGLGFSRAMFFRYSRERDMLVGECAHVNNHIAEIKNDILNERKSGFDFQIKDLKDIIPLIKIPFSENNIAGRALKERDIIYYNDKGYKYNLGNDLFKSLGLKNFLIFPIYNVDYYSGVIICDYFTKDKEITREDVELLKLLLMNISVKLKNKIMEEEKIDAERSITIGKISERFLSARELILNQLLETLEKAKNKDYRNISEIVAELEENIKGIKKSNQTLFEYSNFHKEKLEKVNIEHLMAEVIEEFKAGLASENKDKQVMISQFISYTGNVLGSNSRLKKSFMELLKNAYDAVMASNNVLKKISIIVIRDKHANKIKIDIKDNGIGMSEEQMKNIQEPFVTYKSNNAGLGIPLVIRVIKDCHGVIKFNSSCEEGTTVKITLNIYKEDDLS